MRLWLTGNANGEGDADINKVIKLLDQQALDEQEKEEDGEDGLFFFCALVQIE